MASSYSHPDVPGKGGSAAAMSRQSAVRDIARILSSLTLASATLVTFAQNGSPIVTLSPLSSGTTLPVRLTHELKAGAVKPGSTFLATTTQRIPVTLNSFLPPGTEIVGNVVSSQTSSSPSAPSELTLRFTEIRYKRQTLPIAARTLAIANFVQVMDASVIASGSSDRGNPSPANWTTDQVGGDQVYRSGWVGNVYSSSSHKVGFADYHGVYALPASQNEVPRALGVFSLNSTGLYGFSNTTRLQANGPDTTIIDSTHRVALRKGDDLLLQILPQVAGK